MRLQKGGAERFALLSVLACFTLIGLVGSASTNAAIPKTYDNYKTEMTGKSLLSTKCVETGCSSLQALKLQDLIRSKPAEKDIPSCAWQRKMKQIASAASHTYDETEECYYAWLEGDQRSDVTDLISTLQRTIINKINEGRYSLFQNAMVTLASSSANGVYISNDELEHYKIAKEFIGHDPLLSSIEKYCHPTGIGGRILQLFIDAKPTDEIINLALFSQLNFARYTTLRSYATVAYEKLDEEHWGKQTYIDNAHRSYLLRHAMQTSLEYFSNDLLALDDNTLEYLFNLIAETEPGSSWMAIPWSYVPCSNSRLAYMILYNLSSYANFDITSRQFFLDSTESTRVSFLMNMRSYQLGRALTKLKETDRYGDKLPDNYIPSIADSFLLRDGLPREKYEYKIILMHDDYSLNKKRLVVKFSLIPVADSDRPMSIAWVDGDHLLHDGVLLDENATEQLLDGFYARFSSEEHKQDFNFVTKTIPVRVIYPLFGGPKGGQRLDAWINEHTVD